MLSKNKLLVQIYDGFFCSGCLIDCPISYMVGRLISLYHILFICWLGHRLTYLRNLQSKKITVSDSSLVGGLLPQNKPWQSKDWSHIAFRWPLGWKMLRLPKCFIVQHWDKTKGANRKHEGMITFMKLFLSLLLWKRTVCGKIKLQFWRLFYHYLLCTISWLMRKKDSTESWRLSKWPK